MTERWRVVSLKHLESGRMVPVDVPTVFGRSDAYYRYRADDERPDRLRDDVAQDLAALNYIKLSSDDQVSRTHGLLDPRLPGIRDLNSTNGISLNKSPVPTRAGEAGPLVEVKASDQLKVGRQVFEVMISEVTPLEIKVQVKQRRVGFVGCDLPRQERAQQLKTFLEERKGFTMRDAVRWTAVIANAYRLQEAAHDQGIALCVLCADARGPELILGDEPMAFAKLVPLLNGVPGRKVVILEANGDPTGCEQVFAAMAYEDMVLVTSPGPAMGSPEEEALLVTPTLQSRKIQQMRESLDGHSSLAGAYDDALDAIDALMTPETNRLQVGWAEGYQGRLKLTFGERERSEECALSHSLRIGSSTFRF